MARMGTKTLGKSKRTPGKAAHSAPRRAKQDVVVVRSASPVCCLTDSGVGGSDGDEETEITRGMEPRYDFDEFILSTVQECQKPLDVAAAREAQDDDGALLWTQEAGTNQEETVSESEDDVVNDDALVVKKLHKKHVAAARKTMDSKKTAGQTRLNRAARKSRANFGSLARPKGSSLGKTSWEARGSQTERSNDTDLSWMPIQYYAAAMSEIGVQTEAEEEVAALAKKSPPVQGEMSLEEAYQRGPFWGTMELIQSLSMERFSWAPWVKFIEASSGLAGASSNSFGLYKWSTRKRAQGPLDSRELYARQTARQRFRGRQFLLQGTKFADIDPDQFHVPDYFLQPPRGGDHHRAGDKWDQQGAVQDKSKTPGELSILLGKARNRRKKMSMGGNDLSSAGGGDDLGRPSGHISDRLTSHRLPEPKVRKKPASHSGRTNVKVDKNRCRLSIHLPALGDPVSVPSSPILMRSPVPDASRFDEVNERSQGRQPYILSSGRKPSHSPRHSLHPVHATRQQQDEGYSGKITGSTVSLDLPMSVVKLPQIAPVTSATASGGQGSGSGSAARKMSDSEQWLDQINMYRRQAMVRSPEVPPGTPASVLAPHKSDDAQSSSHSLLLPRNSISGSARPSTPIASPGLPGSRRSSVSSNAPTLKLPLIDEDKNRAQKTSPTLREPVKMPSLDGIRGLSQSEDCIDEDVETNASSLD